MAEEEDPDHERMNTVLDYMAVDVATMYKNNYYICVEKSKKDKESCRPWDFMVARSAIRASICLLFNWLKILICLLKTV